MAVVNGVLHAWREGLVPWVRFSPRRVAKTMGLAWRVNGTGELWENLFESYCPNMSSWIRACENVHLQPSKSVTWWYVHVGMQAPWVSSSKHQYRWWCCYHLFRYHRFRSCCFRPATAIAAAIAAAATAGLLL